MFRDGGRRRPPTTRCPSCRWQARGPRRVLRHVGWRVPARDAGARRRTAGRARAPARPSRQRCAERIVTLLNDPGAGFASPPAACARLRPADIAVLVRTGREAAAVRQALRRRGVASVYLSDKDSVFAQRRGARPAAAAARPWPRRWTPAWRAPRWPRPLLGPVAGRTGAAGHRRRGLRRAQRAAAAAARRLAGAGRAGDAAPGAAPAGPAGALAVAPTATADAGDCRGERRDGERRLTNVLHLAELLQAASARLDGEQALIRWLAAQMQAAAASGDEQIVRLESDADLVQVDHRAQGQGPGVPAGLPAVCLQLPRASTGAHARSVSVADAQGGARCTCSCPTSSSPRPTRIASARTCACSTWR